jgi:hypothetical protein
MSGWLHAARYRKSAAKCQREANVGSTNVPTNLVPIASRLIADAINELDRVTTRAGEAKQ